MKKRFLTTIFVLPSVLVTILTAYAQQNENIEFVGATEGPTFAVAEILGVK